MGWRSFAFIIITLFCTHICISNVPISQSQTPEIILLCQIILSFRNTTRFLCWFAHIEGLNWLRNVSFPWLRGITLYLQDVRVLSRAVNVWFAGSERKWGSRHHSWGLQQKKHKRSFISSTFSLFHSFCQTFLHWQRGMLSWKEMYQTEKPWQCCVSSLLMASVFSVILPSFPPPIPRGVKYKIRKKSYKYK